MKIKKKSGEFVEPYWGDDGRKKVWFEDPECGGHEEDLARIVAITFPEMVEGSEGDWLPLFKDGRRENCAADNLFWPDPDQAAYLYRCDDLLDIVGNPHVTTEMVEKIGTDSLTTLCALAQDKKKAWEEEGEGNSLLYYNNMYNYLRLMLLKDCEPTQDLLDFLAGEGLNVEAVYEDVYTDTDELLDE